MPKTGSCILLCIFIYILSAIWAVGHYRHGIQHKEIITEIVRRTVEDCDSLNGFLMLFSLGGGTGSGLGSFILSTLEDTYRNVDRWVACVHPGSYDDVITSPYNTALTLKKMTDHATCVFPVDNKALFDICNQLVESKEDTKPYNAVNNLIVKMLLHVTSGSRFPGPLNVDLSELSTNMAPFQGLHYLTSSFSPLGVKKANNSVFKSNELLASVCSRTNQLLRVDPFAGTLLSATLLCRGGLSLSDSRDIVDRFYKKSKFVSWNKTGVKTGLCSVPLVGAPNSLLCLTNSTSMSNLFADTHSHFKKLYKKKAHVHHYMNEGGFEDEEFQLASSSILDTIEKYKDSCRKIEVPRIDLV